MSCLMRPILSRDDPPAEPKAERPVPRNMKITQDNLKKFGYTPGCAKCRKLSRNEYSHPSLAHSQDCRIRIEAASKADPTYRERVEGVEFYAKEVEQMDNARRASLEPSVVPRPPAVEKLKTTQVFARPNGLVSQHKICQGNTNSKCDKFGDPCGATRCDSVKLDSSSDLSGLFK